MSPQEKASPRRQRWIVGVSGASGGVYACRLIEALLGDPSREVHATVTAAGLRVLAGEMPKANPDAKPGKSGLIPYLRLTDEQQSRLFAHACNDIGAGPASGTFPAEGMIIVPCSMNTLAHVAAGLAPNLLTRAAAVTLKEGRPLVLVPRETPLTLIDLRNMTTLAETGAVILPANPGFYHNPQTVEDLVSYVVQKIFDRLRIPYPDAIRWSENKTE